MDLVRTAGESVSRRLAPLRKHARVVLNFNPNVAYMQMPTNLVCSAPIKMGMSENIADLTLEISATAGLFQTSMTGAHLVSAGLFAPAVENLLSEWAHIHSQKKDRSLL